MTAAEFVSRLGAAAKAKPEGKGWKVCCPAHNDRTPSLSVASGADGRVLLTCRSQGCTAESIVAAVGLKMSDLFNGEKLAAKLPAVNGEAKPKLGAVYRYDNANGEQLYQVLRYSQGDKKTFRQRHKVNGDWVWNMDGVQRVPYRLPEVGAAVEEKRTVFICEGEKDCDAVAKLGFVATCNSGGAGKWSSDYAPHFKDADVCIIADKDDAGRKHAQDVASKLSGHAATIRVLELPGEKVKDAYDWISAGGEAAELDELCQAAPLWKSFPIGELPTVGNLENGETQQDSVLPWLELIQDGASIQVEELPPVVEIVEGIVAEQSKLTIASGSKSFKTWLTMDLALSIAHGVPFLGRPTIRQRVMYVNLELKAKTFKRRVQTIAKAKGIRIDDGWFLHLPLRGHLSGLPVMAVVGRLIALDRRLTSQVVIIDPVYKLNTEGDENSSRDQTRLFNELDRITTEAGCTLILNDHFGKGNQSEKDPLDAIRGSSAKGGDVDAAMVLRRHEVEGCFSVDLVHRELPPVAPFCIGWKFPLMELRPDLHPEDMKKLGAGRKPEHDAKDLLIHIADTTAGNPISIAAWAKKADIPRQTLSDYSEKFRQKGWTSTVGEGNTARQFITEEGKKLL